MLITRATRHDRADLQELYAAEGRHDVDLARGSALIARDGRIAGALRLVEIAPNLVVVDDVVVRSDRRGHGLGTELIQAAMKTRGGTMFLCCHEERLAFYGRLGFSEVPFEELPEEARAYFESAGDHPTSPDHVHYFLRAR